MRSAHPTEADGGASWSSRDYVYRMEAGAAVLPRPRIKQCWRLVQMMMLFAGLVTIPAK